MAGRGRRFPRGPRRSTWPGWPASTTKRCPGGRPRLRPGLLQQIGLRNGDVLQRVNGPDIHSPEEALKAYRAVQREAAVRLDLLRRNSPTTLTCEIPWPTATGLESADAMGSYRLRLPGLLPAGAVLPAWLGAGHAARPDDETAVGGTDFDLGGIGLAGNSADVCGGAVGTLIAALDSVRAKPVLCPAVKRSGGTGSRGA